MTSSLQPPHGLNQIIKVFGDIDKFIGKTSDGAPHLSAEFERQFIVRLVLPVEIKSTIKIQQRVTAIRCHYLLRDTFARVFADIIAQNLARRIHTIDGCFAFRPQRSSSGLSVHSWGIAIDLNAQTNQRGTGGDMDSEIVGIFKNLGFIWGGDWKGKRRDPMHFQFCTGY